MDLPTEKPKVHFTYPAKAELMWWEKEFVIKIKESVDNNETNSFILTESPKDADLIILLESNIYKTQKYIKILLKDPLIVNFPNKIFTINYEDSPVGFLPGLYVNLPKDKYNPLRHRAWGYMHHPNGELYSELPSEVENCQYLFSFKGAISHLVRQKILETKFSTNLDYKLTVINKWFDHTENEVIDYRNEILNSFFVLCPRGLGCSTYRLFETMASARCPVIISDDWVPIEGIDWEKCSVIIKESELETIPQILERKLDHALVMGKKAREAWERYFSPENKYNSIVNKIMNLKESRPPEYDERIYQHQWSTRSFYKQNGWAIEQRLIRKAKKMLKPIVSKLK